MDRELAARWSRRVRVRGPGSAPGGIRIEVGSAGDYRALARFHYRAGAPATWALVLRAVDARSGAIAGVLVVSMPTLHGSARRRAWPGVFEDRDPVRAAAVLRRELRTISRVVIDPRYRGLGVATALVRRYLTRPLTPRTEAVAAMGECCPLFAAAGMREVEVEPHRRHARLARALRAARVSPAQLLAPRRLGLKLARGSALRRELRAWARAARPPRELVHARVERLARAAGMALLAKPRAYVAG
ncbi:MAG: hypothetical protein IT436_00635 [Phycisphaerales bacterium]|nr:hypothetical protein [Phycisphaerales bacterium]